MDKEIVNKRPSDILPQKYPFVFVDGITNISKHPPKITCYKNVTLNDYFFQGHFPGNPVMPGVLIIEALAQAGLILFSQLREIPSEEKDNYHYYLGKTQARFTKPVKPGDRLILEVEMEKVLLDKGMVKGTAFVKGSPVATAQIIFGCKRK